MTVVSIMAVLATLVMPSLLRSRTTALETTAIVNLRTLASSLELYQTANNRYPDSWQTQMYTAATPPFGPASFNTAMAGSVVQGYAYTYTAAPAGCTTNCTDYALSGIPQILGLTGTRAFFLDRSSMIRHCRGAGPADATSQPIGQPPVAC